MILYDIEGAAKSVKQMIISWKRQNAVKKAADMIGLCIIFAGIGVSIFMNCVGRTLWLDEAMLAFSFSKRSFFGLTSGVFEWEQSAPVLYLYLVKLLTVIFGNTEFVLRSFSVLSYAAVLGLSAYVAKKLFRVKYPILAAAFLANMNFILKYSNEFKQYLSECIWVLLVLVLYYFYKERNLVWWKMALGFMIFIWGANPACFFIGGVLLYEFFSGVSAKDKMLVRNSILTGAGVGVSFIVYYVYWLRGTALSGVMQSYWENASFPLIPKSIDDLKMAQAMVYEIFITFREARIFIIAFVIAAFIIGIVFAGNRYCTVILLGFFVTLFASYIHMFPVADRLWCFSFPIFTILAFYAIDQMAVSSRRAEIVAVFLMFTLMLTNNGILVYRHAENVFQKGEEANPCIAYLEDHVTEGEKVYVYYHSIPVTKYKIGYETERIGNVTEDNIIWAEDTLEHEEDAKTDIEKVLKEDKCYLLASHTTAERFRPLLDAAKEQGNLEIVMNEYETPLYYYTREPENMKGRVSYELISQEEEGDTCYVTIRIRNTGAAYINTEFDDVKVGCRQREDIGTNLWGNLAPGSYFDMPLQFDWNGDTAVALQLRNGEKYWYEELGIAPITIAKGNVSE